MLLADDEGLAFLVSKLPAEEILKISLHGIYTTCFRDPFCDDVNVVIGDCVLDDSVLERHSPASGHGAHG